MNHNYSYPLYQAMLLYRAFYRVPYTPKIAAQILIRPLDSIESVMIHNILLTQTDLIQQIASGILFEAKNCKFKYFVVGVDGEIGLIEKVYAFSTFYVDELFSNFLNGDYATYLLTYTFIHEVIVNLYFIHNEIESKLISE